MCVASNNLILPCNNRRHYYSAAGRHTYKKRQTPSSHSLPISSQVRNILMPTAADFLLDFPPVTLVMESHSGKIKPITSHLTASRTSAVSHQRQPRPETKTTDLALLSTQKIPPIDWRGRFAKSLAAGATIVSLDNEESEDGGLSGAGSFVGLVSAFELPRHGDNQVYSASLHSLVYGVISCHEMVLGSERVSLS